MQFLRTIVVDDEPRARDRLIRVIKTYSDTLELVGQFDSVSTALEGITALKPDVVFLDVHLNDETGFDLLKILPKVDFEVIFITAYDRYAIEAFRFSAIDYLLKPLNPSELTQAIEKLRKKYASQELAKKMAALLQNLDAGQVKKIAIPSAESLSFVHITDIIRCQADVNYTHFFLNDGSKLTVARTLKYYEELLQSFDFLRVHHSHLINLKHVEKYTKGKGGYITMSDGSMVEVSVRKKELFISRMLA